MKLKLSFDKSIGHFILQAEGHDSFYYEGEWTPTVPGRVETNNLAAASRFKQYSDDSAISVFKRICNEKRILPKKPLPDFLDPHQVEGVKWALTRKRSFLHHAPGAGKSLTAMVVAEYTDPWATTVIICPPTLIENWKRELLEWQFKISNNDSSISTVRETVNQKHVDWTADYIIVPHSMLTKTWVYNRLTKLTIGTLIVDEASNFKECTSQRALALYGGRYKDQNFSGLIRGSHRVVLLDGSPMPNRPIELWPLLYGCTPETIEYMGRLAFGLRYGGATQNDRGAWEFRYSSNESELRDKLHRSFMQTVRESELSHSERSRKIIYMTEDPRTPDMREWELRNLTGMNDFTEENSQGELASHRRELGVKKIPWIEKYTKERLENGEAILLFCWHREVAEGLYDGLKKYKPGLIIGGVSARDRQLAIDGFRNGDSNLNIVNIRSGGVGLNGLQRATRIVFGEWSFSDEYNTQCEKRASRRGRDKDLPVLADYICAPDSMDEKVLRSVFGKIKRKQKVFGV